MKLRKNLRCDTGVTLVELLIASILVGVVTLGAAGVLIGMRQIQGSSRLANFLVIHSSAVMAHIQRNVMQATGYQTDAGIVLSPLSSPPYYSFRQDVNASLVANNTPGTYTDDTWLVYVQSASTTFSHCRQSAATGSAPGGACLAALTELSNKISAITFTWTASSSDFYVDVQLDTIYTPGSASDPMTNPTYSLSTKITPTAYTW